MDTTITSEGEILSQDNTLVPLDSAMLSTAPDVMARLLLGKRSPNTQRAYARDLQDFFDRVCPSAAHAFFGSTVPEVRARPSD